MLDQAAHVRSTDEDFVEFALAGAPGTGEYRCSTCGYGVTVRASLPQCPMCAGSAWEPAEPSTFERQLL